MGKFGTGLSSSQRVTSLSLGIKQQRKSLLLEALQIDIVENECAKILVMHHDDAC
jgi:hypothetical protein